MHHPNESRCLLNLWDKLPRGLFQAGSLGAARRGGRLPGGGVAFFPGKKAAGKKGGGGWVPRRPLVRYARTVWSVVSAIAILRAAKGHGFPPVNGLVPLVGT